MAERRMFAKTIIDSDAFLDMPLSTQALYFHLSMRADDEGFINNPKKIQRMIGATDDDRKLLIAKSFIIPFESGIVVIKHWKIHNYIRGDRIHETKYIEERAALEVKENGAYTIMSDIRQTNGGQLEDTLETDCRHIDAKMDTEVRLGKIRLDKIRLEEEKKTAKRFTPPTLDEVKAYCQERKNQIDPETFVDFYESKGWMVGKDKMKDWKAAIRTWEKRSKQEASQNKPKNEDKLKALEDYYKNGGI